MRRAAELLGDLLFPRRCPVCDRPVKPYGALICDECRDQLHPIDGPVCAKCGKPLEDPYAEYCADCRRLRHRYIRGCAVYTYHSISGAIYRFKFEGRAEYADFFGTVMAEKIREEFRNEPPDLIIPVPSSAERLRERGYNQAALLAEKISDLCGIPCRSDCLLRVKNTPFLRSLNALERQKKLKNAFIVPGSDVKSMRIMLTDDIYTTGSTIDACADQLLQAGAASVYFCTLAIGESHL
jgi:ComF family protein